MMMFWRSHIVSAMEIFVDAQLPSEEGSGGLKYYYDMLLIVLLAAHDKGAAVSINNIKEHHGQK
jgi:hypothetical protein